MKQATPFVEALERGRYVGPLNPSFQKLAELHAQIEHINLTAQAEQLHALSLRITALELPAFSLMLRSIDEKLKNNGLL
jgi:hypothetical protein